MGPDRNGAGGEIVCRSARSGVVWRRFRTSWRDVTAAPVVIGSRSCRSYRQSSSTSGLRSIRLRLSCTAFSGSPQPSCFGRLPPSRPWRVIKNTERTPVETRSHTNGDVASIMLRASRGKPSSHLLFRSERAVRNLLLRGRISTCLVIVCERRRPRWMLRP